MEDTENNAVESSSRAFKLLFLAIFIDLLGFGIIIPILPFLVKEGILFGILMSSYSLAQFISAPLWGRLSDQVGRRPIILIGLFGSAISFAIFGVVRTYNWYLFSRIIGGIFTGASLPTARAYIADITPPAERARRFGLLGAAFGIGFTFGPAIGSFLSLEIFLIPKLPQQATPALFAALLALINFALGLRQLPESLSMKIKQGLQNKRQNILDRIRKFFQFFGMHGIGVLLVIYGVTTLTFSGFETAFPLYANHVDARITEGNIGYFFAIIGILVAFAQSTLVDPTVKLLGEKNTMMTALSLQIIGFILLGFADSILLLLLVIVPLGLGIALLNPTINSSLSKRIPADKQGQGLGINSSVGSLGRVFGPIYGGVLYDILFPAAPFYIGAIIIGLILILTGITLGSSTYETEG